MRNMNINFSLSEFGQRWIIVFREKL